MPKARKEGAESGMNVNILDELGVFGDPIDGQEGQDDNEDGGKRKAAPTTEELMAQIAELQDRLDRQGAERTLFTGTRQQQQGPQAPEMPEVDMDGLPDPMEQPEEWRKALNSRISDAISGSIEAHSEFQAQQQAAAASVNQRVSGLWEDFQENYPEYAQNFDLVEFAADKVVKKMAGRGADVQQYMFGTSDLFFGDVVKYIDKHFAQQMRDAADEGDDEGDDDESTSLPAPTRRGGRTAGFGGSDSGGRPTGRKPKEKAGDMMAELAAVQRNLKIY